jgi:hypothetical protein
MVGKIGVVHVVGLAFDFVSQQRTVNTDSLAQTFSQYGLVFHIDQLILQGRASAVDN